MVLKQKSPLKVGAISGQAVKPIDITLDSPCLQAVSPKIKTNLSSLKLPSALCSREVLFCEVMPMGSRGQALKTGGFKVTNYHTIMRYNNVRFIVQHVGKRVKLPEMSNSKWAVYVTLGKGGEIKSVSFYNGSRKKYREIDIADHKGLGIHAHDCDPKTSVRYKFVEPRKLTSYEWNRLSKIIDFYNRHDLQDKAEKSYRGTK